MESIECDPDPVALSGMQALWKRNWEDDREMVTYLLQLERYEAYRRHFPDVIINEELSKNTS